MQKRSHPIAVHSVRYELSTSDSVMELARGSSLRILLRLKENTMTVKTEHAELLNVALTCHERTGGAPVEVKDGSKVVKIGPWMGKEGSDALRAMLAEGLKWIRSQNCPSDKPQN